MKTYQMSDEEIDLLNQVKNYADVKKLASFFNRNIKTIQDHLFIQTRGFRKYVKTTKSQDFARKKK